MIFNIFFFILEGKSAWYTNAKVCGIGGEAGGATLSGDGSVAAAWFGARLTLWDTLEGKQKASLAHPALRPQGKLVEFGRGHHMHYVCIYLVYEIMSLFTKYTMYFNINF